MMLSAHANVQHVIFTRIVIYTQSSFSYGRQAVAELEESQVLQQKLHESLTAALQRLEQLQRDGEEVC